MDTITRAYISMLTESTDDSIKQLEAELLEKHPRLDSLALYKSGDNIKLDTIIVKKEHRKSGVGSAVLDDIKQYADKNSKRILLTAGVRDKNWGTTSQSRLDTFYRRNGFVANKGRNKDYSITATHYYDGKSQLKESVEHPMIMLDGVPRHMNNSEGKPIHPTQAGIYNFHRWFGNSKAVDEHGRPKVFYHGTGQDFDNFSHTFTGKGNDEHGAGFYFTDKPDVANSYATSHIVPVYLKLTKPLDRYSEKSLTRGHIEKMIKGAPNHIDTLYNFGDPAGGKYHRVLSDTVDQYAEHNKFHAMSMLHRDFYDDHEKFLDNFKKATGHDGVLVKDRNIATVFHSNQIKSAIGNDGTFDHPTKITESTDHPMIEVNGELKHRHNSLEKPIHHTDDGIKNFHKWFGESKAVDEHGRPKVYYHGTHKNFDSFQGNPAIANGMFFGPAQEAGNFATAQGASVMPVYLKINKLGSRIFKSTEEIPAAKNAQKNGFDGIYVRDSIRDEPNLMVFHSSQIKSAIGNDGTFDHPTKITEENMNSQTTKFYNFSEWKKAAKKHKMTIRSVGLAAGALTPVETFYADHENEMLGGVYHLCKKDPDYFNYGQLTHHENKLKEENMNIYTPKDLVMAAYKQVVSEASNDENLSNIWKTTANQPWHEYMKSVKGVSFAIKQQQGEESAENEASKKRVNDYLTKYKHLF